MLGGIGAAGLGTFAGCVGSGTDDGTLYVGLAWPVLESRDPVVSGIGRRTQLYEPLVHLTHDAEVIIRLAES